MYKSMPNHFVLPLKPFATFTALTSTNGAVMRAAGAMHIFMRANTWALSALSTRF